MKRWLMMVCLVWVSLAQAQDSLMTRFGRLHVERSSVDSTPDSLVLDNDRVVRDRMNYLSLYQVFSMGSRDVVLYGSNCGGSGCSNDALSLLVLAPGRMPRIVTSHDFASVDGTVGPRQENGRIVINLGFRDGVRREAIFDGVQLSFRSLTPARQEVPAGNCGWVRDQALVACRDVKSRDTHCTDPRSSLPMAITRTLDAIANAPGYRPQGFDQLCRSACQTGLLPDRREVREKVCGGR